MWVIDSCDRIRLDLCKTELHQLLQEERLAGASLLVYANKQDIEGALTLDEICDFLEIDKIKSRHCNVVVCCALTGDGLIQGMDWLVSDIASRLFLLS